MDGPLGLSTLRGLEILVVGRVDFWKECRMSTEPVLVLTDYAGNRS